MLMTSILNDCARDLACDLNFDMSVTHVYVRVIVLFLVRSDVSFVYFIEELWFKQWARNCVAVCKINFGYFFILLLLLYSNV